MLSYSFQVLNEQGYKKVDTEEFHNVADLCASVLIKGVTVQLKKGLGREYIQEDEYVEVTPKSLRIRKIYLKEHERKKYAKEFAEA